MKTLNEGLNKLLEGVDWAKDPVERKRIILKHYGWKPANASHTIFEHPNYPDHDMRVHMDGTWAHRKDHSTISKGASGLTDYLNKFHGK